MLVRRRLRKCDAVCNGRLRPYINSSIIMQLLTVAIPASGAYGEGRRGGPQEDCHHYPLRHSCFGLDPGHRRTTSICATAAMQGTPIALYTSGWRAGIRSALSLSWRLPPVPRIMMWLGEQINQKGIGNGISILLFAGIVARMPHTVGHAWPYLPGCDCRTRPATASIMHLSRCLSMLFLAVIWVIVFMNDSERRIPVQYAKRVVGRKMYGGQSTPYPDQGCVCPALCRSSSQARFSPFPSTIQLFMRHRAPGFWTELLRRIFLHRLAVFRICISF